MKYDVDGSREALRDSGIPGSITASMKPLCTVSTIDLKFSEEPARPSFRQAMSGVRVYTVKQSVEQTELQYIQCRSSLGRKMAVHALLEQRLVSVAGNACLFRSYETIPQICYSGVAHKASDNGERRATDTGRIHVMKTILSYEQHVSKVLHTIARLALSSQTTQQIRHAQTNPSLS
nr:hypothetical protein CFP56_41426 [Quercus suber]